jgi:hypothetical protein
MPAAALLVDTMIVIEAVRTGVWNAISGARTVVTVPECANELSQGSAETIPGYVPVTEDHLSRLTVQPLSPAAAAKFWLRYPAADGMDPGERDLLALASERDDAFELCSCDKAAVVAAHALNLIERTVSLEAVANSVGARPNPQFKSQFTDARMGQWRTSLLLRRPI